MGLFRSVAPGKTNSDQVWTYDQIVQMTTAAKAVLASRNLKLHRLSVLAQIFDKTSLLSKEWSAGERTEGWLDRLLAAAHAIRIAEAMVEVKDEPAARECLKRMSKDNMDLADREQSQGKDALWELELLSYLRRHGLRQARMAEPDIVVPMEWGDYPIACKKINSDAGTENQIKSACKQLNKFDGRGIIALNIDETTEASLIWERASTEELGRDLSKLLTEFIDRHREAMQDAVMKGKCDGFVLSVSVLAELRNSKPRFNNQTQIQLWNLTDGPNEARARFRAFGETMIASIASKPRASLFATCRRFLARAVAWLVRQCVAVGFSSRRILQKLWSARHA